MLSLIATGTPCSGPGVPESRDESSLNVIALGLLVAIIPYVTSVIVNALALVPWVYRFGAVPYTLFFSLIPVTFLIAILSNKLR